MPRRFSVQSVSLSIAKLCERWLFLFSSSLALRDESSDCLSHKVEHWRRKARVYAYPKHIVHYKVRVAQLSGHAKLAILIGRLPQEIATEEKARTDFVRIQCANQILASKWRVLAHANGEAKPGRIGVGCRFWQYQILPRRRQSRLEVLKIRLAARDKLGQLG